jgi:hypothetical protein
MQGSEPIAFIVKQFAQYRKRDDIILEVCEKYGMMWPEAAALVREVERGGASHIAAQRAPLLTIVSILLIVGGIVLTGGMIFMSFFRVSFGFVAVRMAYYLNCALFLIGLGMIVGGIRGLFDTMKSN